MTPRRRMFNGVDVMHWRAITAALWGGEFAAQGCPGALGDRMLDPSRVREHAGLR